MENEAAIWNSQEGRRQPLAELYTAEETEAAAKQQDALNRKGCEI